MSEHREMHDKIRWRQSRQSFTGLWTRPGRPGTSFHKQNCEDVFGVESVADSYSLGHGRRIGGVGIDAARGRSANRRAAGRRVCEFSRPFGGRSRAAYHHAAGTDAIPDRRRGIRLFNEPRRSGDHYGAILRGRRPRTEPGKAVQADR